MAHLDEGHIDAAVGEINRQSKANGSTPDDQDLGIDPLGHESNLAQQAQPSCAHFRQLLKLSVLEGCASSQIAQPLAAKRTNLHSGSFPGRSDIYWEANSLRVEACLERLDRRSQRTTGQ